MLRCTHRTGSGIGGISGPPLQDPLGAGGALRRRHWAVGGGAFAGHWQLRGANLLYMSPFYFMNDYLFVIIVQNISGEVGVDIPSGDVEGNTHCFYFWWYCKNKEQ